MRQRDLPRIGIMSSKTAWPGAKNLTDEVRPLLLEDWEDAWETPWDTDAHLVTYYLTGTGQTRFPRITKQLLPKLRDAEADAVTQLLILDYDRPLHQEWTEEALGRWLAHLAAAADQDPIAWKWTLLYTTKHGARLVYVLDQPIPVDKAEGHHRWLCQRMRELGIRIDDIDAEGLTSHGKIAPNRYPTSDWTRLFRLPFVVRDGTPTWEAEIFEWLEQTDEILEVSLLGTLDRPEKTSKGLYIERDDPKPDLDHAMGLLSEVNAASGRTVQSEFYKQAKKRLKGRECFPCLFKHEPIAQPTARHTTIMKFVGEATTLLFNLKKDGERLTTPEHVYGLFLDPVLQLDPDDETPDWTDDLWTSVLYCWANEEAEERKRQEEVELREQDALGLLETITNGMREWCAEPALHGTDEHAYEWVLQHLIAVCDKTCFVMTNKGWYDTMPIVPSLLIPRIRALGMDTLLQTKVPTKSGDGWRSVKAQELIDQHATVVSKVSGAPSGSTPGGTINYPDSSRSSLVLPIYARRTDLEPVFNNDVDRWLKCLFGPHYTEGCSWIGHALAVEEGPICALSIQGQAGAGKKLLVQGLAECFTHEHAAGADALTNQFQPALLSTPVVSVDEGFVGIKQTGKHPADMFRELVGGGKRFVDQKFKSLIEVRNPVRIVFTANNLNVVRALFNSRDMSPEDREAIAIRILHYEIGDTATLHLRAMGGTAHTKGWIAEDGGAASRYILAKHFMWLYHNARRPAGGRLLVEGNGHRSLMSDMRSQGASTPFVIEALIRMIERKTGQFPGLTIEDGRLYVLTSEVLQYFRKELAKNCTERLTANKIGAVFRGLIVKNAAPQYLQTRKAMGRKRWHEVDLGILLRVAREDGWQCEKLEALVAEQIKRGILDPEDIE